MASVAPIAPMTEAMASSEAEWNENKIQNSLNRLQNMHIQVLLSERPPDRTIRLTYNSFDRFEALFQDWLSRYSSNLPRLKTST